MKKQKKQLWLTGGVVASVLLIDQLIKIAVKTSMYLHESRRITDWFFISFTENNGMAFGMEFTGKLFLTLFRLVAVAALTYFAVACTQRKAKTGYVLFLALIIAGAAGNIVDCLFYGCIFTESTPTTIAQVVPFGEGYQTLLHGRVVDMFYFPLFHFYWPDWIPFIGGDLFRFFAPVFNFADASISVGVVGMLLFYRHSFSRLYDEVCHK